MVHGDHNKSRNNGSFAMIILGALMLIVGPQEDIIPKKMSVMVFFGGIVIGSIGFYLKFFRGRIKQR
jgi:hypothetical protein